MFNKRISLAGSLEPGDATHYDHDMSDILKYFKFVLVELWDVCEIVVLNDSFFDKLTFLKCDNSFYHSYRGDKTNPWTIKAANKFLNLHLENKNEI